MSALCLIACVLLVALWVRSYWRADIFAFAFSSSSFVGLGSANGTIAVSRGDNAPGYFNRRWQIQSNVIVDQQDYLLEASSRYRGAFGFGIAQDRSFVTLSAPCWFLVLVFAALAALPWIWRPRFSLRALLIATTLLAVVLGLIVYYANRPPTTPPFDHGDWPTDSVTR